MNELKIIIVGLKILFKCLFLLVFWFLFIIGFMVLIFGIIEGSFGGEWFPLRAGINPYIFYGTTMTALLIGMGYIIGKEQNIK